MLIATYVFEGVRNMGESVDVKECLKRKIFWNKLGTTRGWKVHMIRMTLGRLPRQTFCCGPKERPLKEDDMEETFLLAL
jgi:hypothetical protein